MKNRRRGASGDLRYNSKRALGTSCDDLLLDASLREVLSNSVRYTGNPGHKRNPGNFNLVPSSAPRQNATLCDDAVVIKHQTALRLLRQGIRQGLISKQIRNSYPAQVWVVRNDGVVFEAQLENEERGEYHGYPLPLSDPFRLVVLDRARRAADV